MEFLVVNKYDTLLNLKEYDAEDFLYLLEVAAVAELNKILAIKVTK